MSHKDYESSKIICTGIGCNYPIKNILIIWGVLTYTLKFSTIIATHSLNVFQILTDNHWIPLTFKLPSWDSNLPLNQQFNTDKMLSIPFMFFFLNTFWSFGNICEFGYSNFLIISTPWPCLLSFLWNSPQPSWEFAAPLGVWHSDFCIWKSGSSYSGEQDKEMITPK